jgi:hypothetical protein
LSRNTFRTTSPGGIRHDSLPMRNFTQSQVQKRLDRIRRGAAEEEVPV